MEDRYNRKRSRSRPGRSSSLRMDADKLSGAPTQNNTLNPSQYKFCLHYLQNGLNATAAYRAAYPGVTGPTACTNAYRLLRNAEIRTFSYARTRRPLEGAPHERRRGGRARSNGRAGRHGLSSIPAPDNQATE